MKINSTKGFTLIELLVVISIIGLLSSVVLASLSTVRVRARDTRRVNDLVQLRTALELYASSNNGRYPSTVGAWYGYAGTTNTLHPCGSWTVNSSLNWIPELSPTYIGSLPLDPKPNNNNCSIYLYISNGNSYKVLAHNTVEGGSVAQGKPFSRMAPNCTFVVTPPQPQHWWTASGSTQATYAVYGGISPGYECS